MPTVNVSACDNEMYIVASTPAGTSEIVHLSSGYNDPVSYVVNLQSILPKGSYSLTLIGINWGGPAKFAVSVDGTPYNYENANAPAGVVFSKTIPVTI